MKLIEFPEQTVIIAKDQPEHQPLPAFQYTDDPEGKIACCWQLTWRERLQLLFQGKIWHQILTFHQPLQPQLLLLKKPFTPGELAAAQLQKQRTAELNAFRAAMLPKYEKTIAKMHAQMNARGYHANDRRRHVVFAAEDYTRARELGLLFLCGARIVDAEHKTAV